MATKQKVPKPHELAAYPPDGLWPTTDLCLLHHLDPQTDFTICLAAIHWGVENDGAHGCRAGAKPVARKNCGLWAGLGLASSNSPAGRGTRAPLFSVHPILTNPLGTFFNVGLRGMDAERFLQENPLAGDPVVAAPPSLLPLHVLDRFRGQAARRASCRASR